MSKLPSPASTPASAPSRPRSVRSRLVASAAALAIGLTLSLGACAEDTEPTDEPSESPTTSETTSETPTETASDTPTDDPAAAQRIEITVQGETISPNGDRVEVAAGEPVELVVTADAPGEFHVHSSPEQELAYDAGTTTLSLTIDKPGLVDVESHHLGVVTVQLEVR